MSRLSVDNVFSWSDSAWRQVDTTSLKLKRLAQESVPDFLADRVHPPFEKLAS